MTPSKGDVVKVIPSSKIESVGPLLSAGQVGMSAKDVADVLAYVKSLE